jgi:solute carrier family 45 protein 1/2/4
MEILKLTKLSKPYLVSLGMSKALTAVVWVAGPISGIVVQPYVGARSDNCRVSWGRRKPFMIGGALTTVIAVMLFVWAKAIMTALFGDADSKGTKIATIVFAIICFYALDFAINTCKYWQVTT